MWFFCTCFHYLVGKTFKAGARCALTFNCSLLFLPCPEQGITWSISPAQKGNKNCSLGKIFVFYCKVRHEGRERGNFLGLESSFALKYTFQLGVDADSSNTSASTANCYSLKATRGCCEQITKKNTQIHGRTSRSSPFPHGFLSLLPCAQLQGIEAAPSSLKEPKKPEKSLLWIK